jgi:hypothetical protein
MRLEAPTATFLKLGGSSRWCLCSRRGVLPIRAEEQAKQAQQVVLLALRRRRQEQQQQLGPEAALGPELQVVRLQLRERVGLRAWLAHS